MRFSLVAMLVLLLPSFGFAISLDLDNPNGIAALYSVSSAVDEGQTFVVCSDGTGYHLEIQETASWLPFTASPVPLSEVMDWTPWMLYTTDGRWYARSGVSQPWEQFGVDIQIAPPPCYSPVGASTESAGSLKAKFR